jgi:hypothetical protein
MPNIIVKYEDNTTTTVPGTSLSMQAVPGGAYKHDDKPVKLLTIDLDTAPSATLSVTSTASTMPAQTCFTQYGTSQAGPYKCEWQVSSSTVGSMTISIPSGTSASYYARMAIDDGADMDINIAR